MTIAQRFAAMAAGAVLALLAGGCASINPPPPVDVLPTELPRLAPAPQPGGPATGSLFSAASYRPAFEDQRARYVGDLVTIEILEQIDAKQNSQSNLGRTSKNSGGISLFPFLPSKIAGKTGIEAGYDSSFNGMGDTSSTNQFKSTVTAIVTEVLPNGNLVITGEKQVGVNRAVDVLRFSGIVNPRQLRRGKDGHIGSVISSQYVANVRVISRGLGEQAEMQAMGWLARAFNSVVPF
ncbi:MAG: flagellar basal body L-ring protein FlgH [Comamonadaceae bacterium]|nr:flagellar basal body L-ring protein FlgH [Burkholderiales bacterium]MEB2348510.1 flagellar basal body L-ring protein FlgH [Comamonadaceae bacterium]